ncbi:MAG: HDOD domain-containing protein [Gammaproteobacteria bacterium]|nr:HDOD domain-containing protein [Gammaproteobacteria bacterium]
MDSIYIARQPIYDKNLEIVAYELLYRDNNINAAVFDDGKQASSLTIVNSFIHIGIEDLVGTALAFINLPTDFILDSSLIPALEHQTVIEVLEDVEPTEEVVAGIKKLKSMGYKIALDDFIYSDKYKPMLALADFVKIDVLHTDNSTLSDLVSKLRAYDSIKLIAEKVETHEVFQQFQALGFDYYQGYFFCKPILVEHKNLPANKAVVLNLLNQLHHPDTEVNQLEAILTQDVSLSFKLLRYINSAAFSLRREIESVKEAIVLLGLGPVKNWASLILLTKAASDKPDQLIVTALLRAKMSELLAVKLKPAVATQVFVCGLFSVLDALMDKPMVELLDNVPLSTNIKVALLEREGELGELLNNCIHYERAEFNELDLINIDTGLYHQCYLAAAKWADETMRELKA